MFTIRETDDFSKWIAGLRDMRAKARIAQRIVRLADGNFGDAKPISEGVSELRIDYGPGYRVYFMREGSVVFLLLCGGDKSSQRRDIDCAKALARAHKGDN